MKIISRAEFLKLPKGIIYATYNYVSSNNAPGDDVDQILIKGETIGKSDWYYIPLIPDARGNNEGEIETEWLNGEIDSNYQIKSEHYSMREGGFDDLDRYVIFNDYEIRQMTKYLRRSLNE